jgi:hypothetical protein
LFFHFVDIVIHKARGLKKELNQKQEAATIARYYRNSNQKLVAVFTVLIRCRTVVQFNSPMTPTTAPIA